MRTSPVSRQSRCWSASLAVIATMLFAGAVFADSGNNEIAKVAHPIAVGDDGAPGNNQTQTGSQTIVAAPSNDTCASPTPLPLNLMVPVDTSSAADDYQTPATAACFQGIGQTLTTSAGKDVVFAFTAPSAGSYTFMIVQKDVTSPIADQNEVLYVSDTCPGSGVVNCIKGANRPTTRSFVSATGTSNNQSEQVTCVPMSAGQTYYVFFDNAIANTGAAGAAVEARPCLTEVEPNDSPATANPIACGIAGSGSVAPLAHCHLGFRGGSDSQGLLNDGAVCTRSTPVDQSLPTSNTKCTISGNACSWDPSTGIDTCPAGEGHCQQLADLDCDPHCTGGPNDGRVCSTNAFCNPGSAQNATCAGNCQFDSQCIVTATGLPTGVSCTPICVGGTFAGRYCNTLSDCTGGGGVCTANAACPSGQTCGRQFNEGDADFYSLGTVPTGNKIFAGVDSKAANDYDFRMRITTTTATLQFDDDDGVSRNGSASPEIAGTPGTGTDTFVKVSRTQARQSEPYLLYSIIRGPLASAQLEDETGPVGNDIYFGWPGDVLSANYVTNGGYVRGLFNGTHGGFAFDSDCFKFLVHEGDLMSWYGDGEPARSSSANTQFPQPVIYDAEPAGISNFIFGANARKNTLTANATLNGLSPAVTSTFFQWRATYTGMLEVCYYDAAVPLGLGTPGNGIWAGSMDVNCGPLQPAGPGTTTTDVAIEKTIVDGTGQAGTLITYQIKVTNSSSDIAQEVHLHDELNPNVTFVSLAVDDQTPTPATISVSTLGGNTTCVTTDGFNFLSGIPTCGAIPADIPIDCINTSMAPGGVTTYTLVVQVDNCIGSGVDLSNTASITTVSTDPDPSNDSSTAALTSTDDGSCRQLFQDLDTNTCLLDNCFAVGTCDGTTCNAPAVNCDDNNVCTDDSCDPATGCINDSTNNGDLCEDFVDCTANACDPQTGCVFPPLPPGTGCSDGLNCTTPDACDGAGNCVGVSVCDDGNACTDDFADESNSCACSYAPSFPGSPCDDGNACTGTPAAPDSCDGASACVGGAAANCDDGNACTDDSCDPATGCVHTPVVCDDGNACNGAETCNPASGCVAGTPLTCNDGNACNGVETCNPASGCVGGTIPNCDDNNPCTADSCQPSGGCQHENLGIACDDGNACTGSGTCVNGTCAPGPPISCSDGNPCTDDACSPDTGCTHTNNTAPCDDGNAGTSGDTCQNGVCTGSGCNSTNDPKSKGWYRSLCTSGGHSGDSITDADAACVAGKSATFAGITTAAQVCDVLDPSHGDNGTCSKAEDWFISLLLNVCKQRVCETNTIDSNCSSSQTVGQSIHEADALLANPGRSNAQCTQAQCLSQEIDTGHALEFDTVTSLREGGNIRLNWIAPSTDDGTTHPRSYKIYRRAIGSLAPFVQIGSTAGTTYLDLTAGSGNWQYDVTSVF